MEGDDHGEEEGGATPCDTALHKIPFELILATSQRVCVERVEALKAEHGMRSNLTHHPDKLCFIFVEIREPVIVLGQFIHELDGSGVIRHPPQLLPGECQGGKHVALLLKPGRPPVGQIVSRG